MSTPLLRVFDDFDLLNNARDELLAAGWLSAAIQLRVMEDDGGPVEGNFLVGNGRPVRSGARSSTAPLNNPPRYELNFAKAVWRGVYLLVVEVADVAQSERCAEILRRFDCADAADRCGQLG